MDMYRSDTQGSGTSFWLHQILLVSCLATRLQTSYKPLELGTFWEYDLVENSPILVFSLYPLCYCMGMITTTMTIMIIIAIILIMISNY